MAHIQNTKISLLTTVSKIIEKYNKYQCYASQNTLLDLLHRYQNVTIKRRMLNYHLSDLRAEGLIRTQSRTKRGEDGTLCLLSSATCLTQKGAYFLAKMGNTWALRHLKSLKKRYGPEPTQQKKDDIQPTTQPPEVPPPTVDKNPFLDKRLRTILGLKPDPPFSAQTV